MDTPSPFSFEDILRVCTMLDGITHRGHEHLERGQAAILSPDERARIVLALELLNRSVFELSSLILKSNDEAIHQPQRPFLYLV
ncbi:hypothetical protein ACYZTX_00535 [Pseudomonas sp. MDT1-17]